MSGTLSVRQLEKVQSIPEHLQYQRARILCWSVCIGLAILDAWAGRQYADADSVSYLDMSDALLKHNWHLLINPQWSPLYPFVVGVATWLARPSAYWELPLAHLVNFFIFLGTLASFEFLMRQVIPVIRKADEHRDLGPTRSLPIWTWQLLGYSLFAWSTFVMISGLRRVNPDLCVALFVYLDAGLLLKLRTASSKTRTCLLLGLTLGLGYLAKAILFPMAFVFMAVAFFVIGEGRKAAVPLLATFVVFGAIAAPMVIQVSRMAGRPSFSESGPLNLVWQANGGDTLPFNTFRSSPDLKHRMTLLNEHPVVLGFERADRSTYSPWFDPQYWNAGEKTAFNPQNQIRTIARNLVEILTDPYLAPMWILIAGGIALFFMNPEAPSRFQHIANSWPLLVPGIAGISIYVLVLVLPRYIAPFLVLVFLGFFPCFLLHRPTQSSKPTAIVTSTVAACLIAFSAFFVLLHLLRPIPSLRGYGGEHYRAAVALNGDGVLPGQPVGLIDSSWDVMIWARLARVHVIAQIPPDYASSFWHSSNPSVKTGVYDAFAKAGARAIITEDIPPSSGFADWQQLGDTRYYVHLLVPPQNSPSGAPTL